MGYADWLLGNGFAQRRYTSPRAFTSALGTNRLANGWRADPIVLQTSDDRGHPTGIRMTRTV